MAIRSRIFRIDTGLKPDRREALMIGSEREQRTAIRFFVTAPVVIYANGVRHVGLIRDVSGKGLFVYSDFQPACGDTLSFTLQLPKNMAKHLAVNCRGRVVRVEPATSGAAIGFAIVVEEYAFRKLAA
jgi:hypothetical protein